MNYRFDPPGRTSTLFIVAFAVSLLISAWMGYRETLINSDAICYLLSAKSVGTHGIHYAANLCNQARWPFFSILIYGFATITHLPYTIAAYVLDAFFSMLSVGAFILIVKELGGTQRVLWLAAITILLSHQFNSVREYIIRDHGFWAFYLGSMLFLLKYARRPRLKFALAFNVSLILATLFRIEGAIFLLLLPFVTWFQKRYSFRQRTRNFILLYMPMLLIGSVIALWMLLHPQESMAKLGRVGEVIQQFHQGIGVIGERFHAAKSELKHSVLSTEGADQAGLLIISAWLAWYSLNVISNLSWIYSFLCIYAMRSRTIILRSTASIILYWYIGINIIITASFLGEHLFLSKRYLIALSLVLMLWVPFALNDIIRKWPSARYRTILAIAALLIVGSSIGGIIDFGYSKQYVRDAGRWLENEVPAQSSIYSNDIQLMYYSNHFGDDIFDERSRYGELNTLEHRKWKEYDYLALRLEKKDQADNYLIIKGIDLTPVKTFKNKRGDRVVIYKTVRGGTAQ